MRIDTEYLNPKIKIRISPIHIRGMFAISYIKEGEVLVRWGNGYTDKAGAAKAQKLGEKTMQWDDNIFSIETRGNPDAYSINHSCDPNAWMDGPFKLTARRNVNTGEEITADYAMWVANEDYVSTWDCKCGSRLCRGKVTGKDWKIPALQKRYQGHFSPLINKRILR